MGKYALIAKEIKFVIDREKYQVVNQRKYTRKNYKKKKKGKHNS